jgi:hypothetical protein
MMQSNETLLPHKGTNHQAARPDPEVKNFQHSSQMNRAHHYALANYYIHNSNSNSSSNNNNKKQSAQHRTNNY